ncbi:cysteine desulfurase family protein [Brevundimonas sp. SL130]|uniref:cysteine desulfurase family protein n=1 Tax=Brevundimonas sp. SL130 TaxID=2995143 RepID=UPI00226D3072|nr:aminotransferase class V-fold PLP-dependent enzyme [Brevundimonas sp. SL130]WAC59639.1 aminotransferase class V-fold PLP-dependent enzyme [Brevundimonas sp. SL130]
MSNRPIYLDYQATTPVDRSVLEAMLPFFTEVFGNAHSGEHPFAIEASDAIEIARRQVADLIGAQRREIVFTSGATEANNLLIAGGTRAMARHGRNRLVTLETEHKSVLEVATGLAEEGFDIRVLPVESDGIVDLDRMAAAIDDSTAIVSVMAANNEIGVIQPLAAIGKMCRAAGAGFHVDAAQAAGKIPLNVLDLSIDLMSLSAHKFYGPKGVGAAFISRKAPSRPLPISRGGGQENGLRPGTLPTALCVGMGAACELAALKIDHEAVQLIALRDRFLAHLVAADLTFDVNGDLTHRLPGNLNVTFLGVDAEALLMTIRNQVAAASGSACTAQSLDPSYVVQALGFGDARAEGAVRFGFGRMTTVAEVDTAAAAVIQAVRNLRRVSYAPERAISA